MTTSNFTIQELIEDARYVADNKKTIKEKYGFTSNKSSEIERDLLKMANDMRRERGTLTEEDIRIFNRFWNVPESAKKIREAMAEESTEFVQFYLDYYLKDFHGVNTMYRCNSTRISVLESIIAERKEAKDEILPIVIKTLTDQTVEFHDRYIDSIMNVSIERFDALKEKYESIKYRRDMIAKFGDQGWQKNDKMWSKIERIRRYTCFFNKDQFIEETRKNAERDFEESIKLIAVRIKDAGMNFDKIQVKHIADGDAKAFDIYVSDGNRTMHARSIFAAEFSSIVTPHYRFIITNA